LPQQKIEAKTDSSASLRNDNKRAGNNKQRQEQSSQQIPFGDDNNKSKIEVRSGVLI
jgi:hypothetical protein